MVHRNTPLTLGGPCEQGLEIVPQHTAQRIEDVTAAHDVTTRRDVDLAKPQNARRLIRRLPREVSPDIVDLVLWATQLTQRVNSRFIILLTISSAFIFRRTNFLNRRVYGSG